MILQVAFLDVFHGDGAVITFQEEGETRCIVVDGGETREAAFRLNAWLRHQGVQAIDLLVGTHIDADHINGLVNLLERESCDPADWNGGQFPCIRHYWGPLPDPSWQPTMPAPTAAVGAPTLPMEVAFVAESVRQNQSLDRLVRQAIADPAHICHPSLEEPPATDLFEGLAVDFLSPDRQIPDSTLAGAALTWAAVAGSGETENLWTAAARAAEIADRDANNQSIVFRLRPQKEGRGSRWSFLFTGDAGEDAWRMMLSRHEPEDLAARVLKMPHHGSHRNGIIPEALEAINPACCVISVGQKHGLPDAETLNLVRGQGERRLFCTERNNDRRKRGPCWGKSACPRRTKRQFRSLLVEVDTETDEAQFHLFTISPRRGQISWKPGPIWCPETSWSVG